MSDDPYRKAARKQDQARRLRTHEGQRNHFIGELAVNQVKQIIREDDEREEAQALRLKHPLHLIRT